MKALLTLHGVGTLGGRGPWQKSIGKVLEPHFDCIPIKYQHYRWLGIVSAVVEPRLLVLGVAFILVLKWCGVIQSFWSWIWTLVVVALSLYAARFRHRAALDYFVGASSGKFALGVRPHVIAHSMGTKLVGTVLRDYPQTSFTDIVLAGCVLPTKYPWGDIKAANPARFNRVRNDVGGRDIIASLTHQATKLRLLRDFGPSGGIGFDDQDGVVHTFSSRDAICPKCEAAGESVPVHNVICSAFYHSSIVDSPEYAAYFWLPFLWGIEPAEYRYFLELCLAAKEHHQKNNWRKVRLNEEELLQTEWRWTEGMSLGEYIDDVVAHHPEKNSILTPVTGQVLRKVWEDIVDACVAHHDRGNEWERRILALNPEVAVIGAVDAILRKHGPDDH